MRGTKPSSYGFYLAEDKAMRIADPNQLHLERFPLGELMTVKGRLSLSRPERLNHVSILYVGGMGVVAWERLVKAVGLRDAIAKLRKGQADAAGAVMDQASRDAAIVDRAALETVGQITDPTQAFEDAMSVVRRQMRLKDPKLSSEEIQRMRDALNVMGKELGIV
jgi:uncharacterized Ntn-hydrolase superfamily protein